jgi:hypothetical protein
MSPHLPKLGGGLSLVIAVVFALLPTSASATDKTPWRPGLFRFGAGIGLASLQDVNIPVSEAITSTLPVYALETTLVWNFERFSLQSCLASAYWGSNRLAAAGVNLPVGSKNYTLWPLQFDNTAFFRLFSGSRLFGGIGFSLEYLFLERATAISSEATTALRDSLLALGPNYGISWQSRDQQWQFDINHALLIAPLGQSTWTESGTDAIEYNQIAAASRLKLSLTYKFSQDIGVMAAFWSQALLAARLNAYVLNTYSANLLTTDSLLLFLVYEYRGQ